MRGSNRGRVNIADAVCFRPGQRSRFFHRLRVCRGRKDERKAFTWSEYRDLIIVAHLQPQAPVVWCWDNLNVHLARELGDFARENKEWLRVFQLPSYAPDLNPAEGIRSLLKRFLANFAAADLDRPVKVTKRGLKKIRYRPHLIDGRLTETGLIVGPPDTTGST